MIKVETNKGVTSMSLEGTGVEITADILCIIESVYKGFKEDDESIADCFKEAIMNHIEECFKTKEELAETLTDKQIEVLKTLDEIQSLLNGLMSDDSDKHFKS